METFPDWYKQSAISYKAVTNQRTRYRKRAGSGKLGSLEQPRWYSRYSLQKTPIPWKSSLGCGLCTPPLLGMIDLSGAFIFVSLPQASEPLAGIFADAPAVRGKDYLSPLAPTVGCVTLPPIYFRILPKEYSDARWPKAKSTKVFRLNHTLKVS